MKVFQLSRCGEYWMEEDLGLFETMASARMRIDRPVLLEAGELFLTAQERGIYSIYTGHYTKPNQEKVIVGDGFEVTALNIASLTENPFDFYDITHAGYQIWGIFEREVLP